MTPIEAIVSLFLAFGIGATTSWLIAEHKFIRPLREQNAKAMKMVRRASDLIDMAFQLVANINKERKEATKNGLVLSPIQVKWPGKED